MPTFDDVEKMRRQLNEITHQYWAAHNLFTWQWWFLSVTFIATWVVWWKVVDKRRIHLIANFGFVYALLAFTLDMIGIGHGAWAYPVRVYWAFDPPLLIFDTTYFPVIYMLVYQRYGNARVTSFIAFTVTSAIISFVFEPMYSWLGIYHPYTWKYVYSFPIYAALAFLARYIVGIFENARNKVS